MMRKYGYGALALLFAAFGCRAEITEAQIAADCAKINDYAKQGNQFYQAKTTPKRGRRSFSKPRGLNSVNTAEINPMRY